MHLAMLMQMAADGLGDRRAVGCVTAKERLLQARERLTTTEQFHRMWEEISAQEATGELLAAWIAKEELRYLLSLARQQAALQADDHQSAAARVTSPLNFEERYRRPGAARFSDRTRRNSSSAWPRFASTATRR
jgi:hypothetical protein